MAKLTYTSIHPCHLTLQINGAPKEFSFFQNKVYELPEDNSIIIRMKAQGLLEATDKRDYTEIMNTDTMSIDPQLKNKKSNGS